MTLLGKPDFHADGCVGETTRIRDTTITLLQALNLTGRASSEEWLSIKQTVKRILVRHNLVGKLPSTIEDFAIRTTLGQELESAHPKVFGALQPSAHRRDLMLRIFIWTMKTSRRNSRRRMLARDTQPPYQLSPQPLSQPPILRPPSRLESPVASPWDAEYSAVEDPEDLPMVEPLLPGSIAVELSSAEPPSVEPSGAESSDAESTSADTEGEPMEGILGLPPAAAPTAEYLPASRKPLAMNIPRKPLATIPIPARRKELIVTVLAPEAPRFEAKFMKRHLLKSSILSMARLFEILAEEGFCHGPEDYVIRDEFQNRLSSDRDLAVGFQNLASAGKLVSVWKLLRKDEDRILFPGSGFDPLTPAKKPNEP